jgi:phosphatidylethanolamine-binding protein
LDDFTPSHLLSIEWGPKSGADLGNTLKPKDLQEAPLLTIVPAEPSTGSTCAPLLKFVIAATDPDAPSRDDPKWSEFCHWIAKGLAVIDGADCSSVTITELEDVMPYKPPGPPKKTGKHRYVFVAFAPVNGTTEDLDLTKPKDRQNWGTGKEGHGVRDWMSENGLRAVGEFTVFIREILMC